MGVDLARVNGTGTGGRITEEDVKAAVRTSTAEPAMPPGPAVRTAPLPDGADDRDTWGTVRRQAMSKIRKTIAINMARSASTIPHVTNFDDADITELDRIRKGGLADYIDPNIKLTMMPFVMKAVAQSLKLHPLLNASVDMDNEQIIYKQYVNIGVAVDTDRGLVVPVVRNVDRMSIPRIAQALSTLAENARKAQFTLDDMRGVDLHDQQPGRGGRHLFDAHHQSSRRGDFAHRPQPQNAGGDRRQDRDAADDAAEPVVRSSHRRRGHGRAVFERTDQLSQGAGPAAAGSLIFGGHEV